MHKRQGVHIRDRHEVIFRAKLKLPQGMMWGEKTYQFKKHKELRDLSVCPSATILLAFYRFADNDKATFSGTEMLLILGKLFAVSATVY